MNFFDCNCVKYTQVRKHWDTYIKTSEGGGVMGNFPLLFLSPLYCSYILQQKKERSFSFNTGYACVFLLAQDPGPGSCFYQYYSEADHCVWFTMPYLIDSLNM